MAAGRADSGRDDALSALPSPAPSSPFSPHDWDALQQLKLRGSLSPHQQPYDLQQQQQHYSNPSIRIHPCDPVQLTSDPSSRSSLPQTRQHVSLEDSFSPWQHQQQHPHQQHSQSQSQHLHQQQQQQQQQQQYSQQQLNSHPAWQQGYASTLATDASAQFEDPAIWEFGGSDANFGLGPAQVASYYLSDQHLQYQQKRASSTSSYASFEPHTPPPSSNQLVPSVEDFDSDALQYPAVDGLPPSLTQEVLKNLDSFYSLQQAYPLTAESVQQQAQALAHTTRFSRDAQQIWQNQRRLAQQRIMSQDSNGVNGIMAPPNLPRTESTDTDGGFKSSIEPIVPKLDRTLSDVYQDTLFHHNTNDGISPTAHLKQPSQQDLHTQGGLMQERLKEASVDHLRSGSQSPGGSAARQNSPFKPNAPESPHREQYASGMGSESAMKTAARVREWNKAQQDHANAVQHSPRIKQGLNDPPKTVSPKEVALSYKEDPDDNMGSLFPQEPPIKKLKQEQTTVSRFKPPVTRENTRTSENSDMSQPSFGSMATSRRESSQSTNGGGGGGGSSRPGQYQFFQKARRQASSASINVNTDTQSSADFPAQLTSADSTRSSDFETGSFRKRSHASSAASPSTPKPRALSKQDSLDDEEDYTYTCTYHGCTRRFDSQSALQKHKRDVHHSTAHHSRNSMSGATAVSPGAQSPVGAQFTTANSKQQQQQLQQLQQSPQLQQQPAQGGHRKSASVDSDSATPPGGNANSQAGPHICTRINPTTGKPCNSQFSRPYDLTRHEDTIHNNKKEKVKCALCKDEKTFSRSDALTRHMRVVHNQKDNTGGGRGRGR